MAEYTLHCFAQSGNAYKPALMLQLAGADWSARFVDYFNGETRTSAYRAINVMGEVPVLEHRGLKLSQSGVILDYLAQRFTAFGPRNDAERREILRWLLYDNHKLTSYTATYRFLKTFAPAPDSAVLAEFRKRAEAAWSVLDAHLGERDYVASVRLTIADVSLCGYLFWPDETGVVWTETHPAIARWLERIRSHPRWVAPYDLMTGHPLPPRGEAATR
jgi:glutathione S-transferase